jgi:heme/copper-type cytochrome/quinol oxidase subunit 4
MRPLILKPVTAVWAALVLATCVAWWSASGGAVPSFEATAIVMIVAAVKARLVILHFMDLKGAPRPWRLLFEGWVVLTTCVILGGYWYAIDTAGPHEAEARVASPGQGDPLAALPREAAESLP